LRTKKRPSETVGVLIFCVYLHQLGNGWGKSNLKGLLFLLYICSPQVADKNFAKMEQNPKEVPYLVDGSDYLLSLNKLTGFTIVDIHGYISREFDEPVFKLCKLVFLDGTEIDVEGEHDLPYLCADDKVKGLSEEFLDSIKDEDE